MRNGKLNYDGQKNCMELAGEKCYDKKNRR